MKYLILLFLSSFYQTVYSQSFTLTLSITNIKIIKGVIRIGIYNEKKKFPKVQQEYRTYAFNVNKYAEVFSINGLPRGEYAIAIYQDENTDGKCNTNFFGLPTEGYGFSKNYKPILTAPSFNECKIDLNLDKSISIKLLN